MDVTFETTAHQKLSSVHVFQACRALIKLGIILLVLSAIIIQSQAFRVNRGCCIRCRMPPCPCCYAYNGIAIINANYDQKGWVFSIDCGANGVLVLNMCLTLKWNKITLGNNTHHDNWLPALCTLPELLVVHWACISMQASKKITWKHRKQALNLCWHHHGTKTHSLKTSQVVFFSIRYEKCRAELWKSLEFHCQKVENPNK